MTGTDALSKKLLLDPEAGMKDPEFRRLRAEEPELEGLHPLALAMVLVAVADGRTKRKVIREAFAHGVEACEIVYLRRWLRDGSCSQSKETVEHELTVSRKGRKLRLRFESEGEIFESDDQEPPYRGSVSLVRLMNDGLTATTQPSDLYARWTKRLQDGPLAYSEDSGSQIGGMAYRLVRVDDVRIRTGGGWYDRYNELENDHGDADGDDQTFRLGQLLSNSEARALGLEHPDQTRRIIVRPEALAESYAKGRVLPRRLSLEVASERSKKPLVKLPIPMAGRVLPEHVTKLLRNIERIRGWLRH